MSSVQKKNQFFGKKTIICLTNDAINMSHDQKINQRRATNINTCERVYVNWGYMFYIYSDLFLEDLQNTGMPGKTI